MGVRMVSQFDKILQNGSPHLDQTVNRNKTWRKQGVLSCWEHFFQLVAILLGSWFRKERSEAKMRRTLYVPFFVLEMIPVFH